MMRSLSHDEFTVLCKLLIAADKSSEEINILTTDLLCREVIREGGFSLIFDENLDQSQVKCISEARYSDGPDRQGTSVSVYVAGTPAGLKELTWLKRDGTCLKHLAFGDEMKVYWARGEYPLHQTEFPPGIEPREPSPEELNILLFLTQSYSKKNAALLQQLKNIKVRQIPGELSLELHVESKINCGYSGMIIKAKYFDCLEDSDPLISAVSVILHASEGGILYELEFVKVDGSPVQRLPTIKKMQIVEENTGWIVKENRFSQE